MMVRACGCAQHAVHGRAPDARTHAPRTCTRRTHAVTAPLQISHNLVHADLHPGNMLVRLPPMTPATAEAGPTLVLLDVGLTTRCRRRNTLVPRCNVSYCVTMCCIALQRVVLRCNMLYRVATCCTALHRVATRLGATMGRGLLPSGSHNARSHAATCGLRMRRGAPNVGGPRGM